MNIVRKSLEEPLRQIAMNAGYEGSIVVEKVKDGKGNFGFDADKGVYGDLMKAGIIDPTKVARFALQNAASVSSVLITTEAMVAEKPKKKSAAPRHARRRHAPRHGRLRLLTLLFNRPGSIRHTDVGWNRGFYPLDPSSFSLDYTALIPAITWRWFRTLNCPEVAEFLDIFIDSVFFLA